MPNKKPGKPPASESLLVELLTEELPPKALHVLGEGLKDRLLSELIRHQLKDRVPQDARWFATPRRLAVCIPEVLAQAQDRENEVLGPAVNAPAQAIAGFAKKHGVTAEQLEQRDTPKGKVVLARLTVKGAVLEDVLPRIVQESTKALPIPKTMRWSDGDATFVRPVHGLVMLHGSRLIPGNVLGAESAGETLGHRFLSGGAIALKHADDYEGALRDKGKVIADFAARRAEIARQLESAAAGSALVTSDALLDEICALVEAPSVYAGAFEREFLAVPDECLILSMQQHQKYVPLRDAASGKLLPRFLFVSNIETKDAGEIIRGNERVLRARLSDAKFFFDQDRKQRLEARVPRLANVVYHNKLGSQLERVERVQLLAGKIARQLGADALLAERAAWLAKADLLTDMVGEFPELQGTMGRHYALHDGEPPIVANAIGLHYFPRFSGDALPQEPVACAVALADKLDTLAGLFSVGQQPTGDRDPFGLRRAALGLVRIVVENQLPLSLTDLADAAFAPFKSQTTTELLQFVNDRFAGYLKERGFSTLQVEAVLSRNPSRPNLVPRQLEAVKAFQALPEAESLAAANKRVANILKQAEAKGESFGDARLTELADPAERALHEAIRAAAEKATPLYESGDYTGYLKTFSVLKSPVARR